MKPRLFHQAPIDELAMLYQEDPNAASDWFDPPLQRTELFTEKVNAATVILEYSEVLEFHNVGLPASETLDSDDYGRYTGIEQLSVPFNSAGILF